MVGRLTVSSRFLFAFWALPVAVPLGWLTGWLIERNFPALATPFHWSPLALWPLSWLLALRFHQSRFFFSLLLTALVWFVAVGGGPTGDHLLRVSADQALFLLFPALLLVVSVFGGRGAFTARATGLWLLLGVMAALWGALAHGHLPGVRHWLSSARHPLYGAGDGVRISASDLIYVGLAGVVVVTGWLRAHLSDGWIPLVLLLVFGALHRESDIDLASYWSVAALLACLAVVQEAYRLAYLDALTGLPGRRALEDYGRSMGRHYLIAMVDVDHFKQFNDTYGHDVGDQVLRMVAGRLKSVRVGGRAFRYGGEEFTLVFAGNDADSVTLELERLRQAIEDSRFTLRAGDRPTAKTGRKQRGRAAKGRDVQVTVSMGMAQRNERVRDLHAVVKAADQALYKAKRKGRNRVESA